MNSNTPRRIASITVDATYVPIPGRNDEWHAYCGTITYASRHAPQTLWALGHHWYRLFLLARLTVPKHLLPYRQSRLSTTWTRSGWYLEYIHTTSGGPPS